MRTELRETPMISDPISPAPEQLSAPIKEPAPAKHANGNGHKRANKGFAPEGFASSANAAVVLGPVRRSIFDVLRTIPRETKDLIQHFAPSMSSASVYSALHSMRKAGLIESRQDPEDGLRKNYVV